MGTITQRATTVSAPKVADHRKYPEVTGRIASSENVVYLIAVFSIDIRPRRVADLDKYIYLYNPISEMFLKKQIASTHQTFFVHKRRVRMVQN